jgi:hypothetical protein
MFSSVLGIFLRLDFRINQSINHEPVAIWSSQDKTEDTRCANTYIATYWEDKGKGKSNRTGRSRGGRGIAVTFLDLGSRRGWVVSTTPRPPYTRERPGTHCTGGWVSHRAGLAICEKSCPKGIRSPDCPACIQSILGRTCKVKFTLEEIAKDQSGSRSIVLLFL